MASRKLNDLVQTVENDALRQRLGLPKGINGVMIAQPYRNESGYPLQEWDVITKIGDMPIDSDGKVAIRYDLRLSASYLVQKFAKNGLLPLTVYRDGRLVPVSLPVRSQRDLVIPFLMDKKPRYFIFGPFVFSQTTQDYLERLGNQPPPSLGRQSEPARDPALRQAHFRERRAGRRRVATVSRIALPGATTIPIAPC